MFRKTLLLSAAAILCASMIPATVSAATTMKPSQITSAKAISMVKVPSKPMLSDNYAESITETVISGDGGSEKIVLAGMVYDCFGVPVKKKSNCPGVYGTGETKKSGICLPLESFTLVSNKHLIPDMNRQLRA